MHTREQNYTYGASCGAKEVNVNVWFILPSTTVGLVSLEVLISAHSIMLYAGWLQIYCAIVSLCVCKTKMLWFCYYATKTHPF